MVDRTYSMGKVDIQDGASFRPSGDMIAIQPTEKRVKPKQVLFITRERISVMVMVLFFQLVLALLMTQERFFQ